LVSIPALIILGVGTVFAFFFFRRAGEVGIGPAGSEVGEAFQSIGTGIGSFGTGFETLGSGIGGGITGLFKPLLFFKDLLFGGEPIVSAPAADTVQSTNSNSNPITVSLLIGPAVGGLIGPAPP